MAEKRLGLDQVPLGSGGGGGGSFTLITKEAVVNGGGTFPFGVGAAWTVLPGSLINFTLNIDQEVMFMSSGTDALDAANRTTMQIGIRVDGTDYEGTRGDSGGFGNVITQGQVAHKALALLAGAYTAELIVRDGTPGNSFGGKIHTSVATPARINLWHIDPIAVVGSLTKQEAIAQGGGNFSTMSTAFVPIPGTQVTVNLNSPQTVLFLGHVTKQGNLFWTETLGIRITSPGPTVTDFAGITLDSGLNLFGIDGPMVAHRAVSLGAGTHTAELILRTINAGQTAIVRTDALRPAVMTAMFTDPEQIVKITNDIPTEVNPGDAGAVGFSTEAARADHEHQMQTDPPVDTAKANVEGNSTFAARANHVHRTILEVEDAGALVGSRPIVNIIGATVVDDGGNDRVNITLPTPATVVDTVKWHVSGNLAIGAKLEGTWVAGRAGTVTRVTFHRETAGGTGGSTIVDVHKGLTTLFTTQGNRPTITQASGNDQIAARTNMEVTAFVQDDKFTFHIDQIETGTAPVDGTLTMEVTYP